MNIKKSPKGTYDIMPDISYKWRWIEQKIHTICSKFAYKEIRTPNFEYTELFERGVGGDTDVVQKEMYTFLDKRSRSLSLRPEGTAGVVRAFLEHSLYAQPQPLKLYYIIPCYRYEEPQAGRQREFHQFGVEVFGAGAPSVDAEVIALAAEFIRELGINELTVNINSVGCASCRRDYNEKLRQYLAGKDLCELCVGRLGKNPMRVLDCKSPQCIDVVRDAPSILDSICADCRAHFEKVQGHLSAMGVDFKVNSGIVRGLDYYTGTVFEIVSDKIGAQGTVCGGGRYDGLVGQLGGVATPAVGFGVGIERILLLCEKYDIMFPDDDRVDLFFAYVGDEADVFTSGLVARLRELGLAADKEHCGRSVKAQMKYADKIGARFTAVIGEDEIRKGRAAARDMRSGEMFEFGLEELREVVKEVQINGNKFL